MTDETAVTAIAGDESNESEQEQDQKPFVVPAGFSYTTETTKVGEVEYPVEYLTAKGNLQAWRDHFVASGVKPEDVDSTIAKLIDEVQTQRATQGGKTAVRDAKDDAARAKAVAKHQANAKRFVLGAPRQRAPGGMTQKKTADFGAAVISRMVAKGGMLSSEELAALALEMGVDPSLLNA